MNEVLKVTAETITIGKEDGTIEEVRPCDLNFVPQVGDEVKIFKTEDKTIVSKVKHENNNTDLTKNGRININVNNSNANSFGTNYAPAGNKKVVNKLVYCLLAFFLGGIGIHKFYSGKTSTGILFLVFCWTGIPMIIALIEFVAALCKRSDSNGNILV